MLRSQTTSLSASLLAVVGVAANTLADTQEVVANTGTYLSAPWQTSFTVPRFNQPFTRLERIEWLASGILSASARCTNSTSFSQFPNINANVSLDFKKPDNSFLASFSIFASGSGFIAARSSSTVSAIRTVDVTGTISGSELDGYIGTGSVSFPASSGSASIFVSGASSSSNRTGTVFAGIRLRYVYTKIGLSQGDPILPSNTSSGSFNFVGVPNDRWFDPPTAGGFEFQMTSADDTFASIAELPTGFNLPFIVAVNGVEIARLSAGTGYTFGGTGVRSFAIYGLEPAPDSTNPRGFPVRLRFNRGDVSFRMSPMTGPLPCPCDLTGDRQVDNADFQSFVVSYNLFSCSDIAMPVGCPADFNKDGSVDNEDFTIFAQAYDRLLCP